ncbi:hypothetical protein Q8A67_019035 [Cirrhinus molitorella]|uniref:Uncharacterized protein n=1 Tax=Cirrhinus molitorella TaxID=172907 RepID=A0AA88TDD9_9TELE|nr:hypothetical protein Q8A67_019035 [Cirrhinus molitorella]
MINDFRLLCHAAHLLHILWEFLFGSVRQKPAPNAQSCLQILLKHLLISFVNILAFTTGHLTPLPLYVCPVYWAYDYTLRVYPLPDVIVFADKYEPFNGSFPRSGFSFKEDSKLQGL